MAQGNGGMTPALQNFIEMRKQQSQTQALFGGNTFQLNPGTEITVHIDKLVSTGLLGVKVLPAIVEKRTQQYVQIYQKDAECSHLKLSPTEEFRAGQSVVARFLSKNRYILCRGIVVGGDERDPNMVKLLLVDELQIRSVDREALYQITPEFHTKPFLAAVVELTGVPKLLTAFPSTYDKLLTEFIEKHRSEEVLLQYAEDGEHFQKVRVSLPGNGLSLDEILKKKLVLQMIPKMPTISEPGLGVICHAKSNGDVFMQLNVQMVEDMTDFLTDDVECKDGFASSFEVLDTERVYLAPFEESWYRARIEKVDSVKGVRVCYIDYGNTDCLPRDQLVLAADVDPVLEEIPPLCVKFHLKWVTKVIDMDGFQEYFDHQKFKIVVKEEGDPPTVILINPSKDEIDEEYYLNKYIIHEKLATK